MPKIRVVFDGEGKVDAEFDGHLYPEDAERYRIEGTIKARCPLYRGGTSFANTVALDHKGESGPWAGGLKEEIVGEEWNTFEVRDIGRRKPGEQVEFRIGINTGLSGQYAFGPAVPSVVGGPAQDISGRWSHGDLTATLSAERGRTAPPATSSRGALAPRRSTTRTSRRKGPSATREPRGPGATRNPSARAARASSSCTATGNPART
ncbi:hypothetical protein ACIQUL_34390 [Streptomyces sp. NPDC090303]|uniref:hypothetical protein n=1 Tax=Streptomyces sp. NPDC090303 TaxID=3365960 RepID=UPI003819C9C5